MMMNRQAITVSLPKLPSAMMYDWWIVAMVIKHQSVVEFIDESLIHYRQHSGNSVGAKKNSILKLLNLCLTYSFNRNGRTKIWYQAKAIQPNLNRCYCFGKKIHITIKSLF